MFKCLFVLLLVFFLKVLMLLLSFCLAYFLIGLLFKLLNSNAEPGSHIIVAPLRFILGLIFYAFISSITRDKFLALVEKCKK